MKGQANQKKKLVYVPPKTGSTRHQPIYMLAGAKKDGPYTIRLEDNIDNIDYYGDNRRQFPVKVNNCYMVGIY